jgi:hypothetical protein
MGGKKEKADPPGSALLIAMICAAGDFAILCLDRSR